MKNDHIMRRSSTLGFSLLELMVVIVLVGFIIAIALPTMRVFGGLDLRNEITKLAGLTTEVYALASISGKTHRLVLDLDSQTYWVEEKVSEIGEIRPELGYEDLMKARIKNDEESDSIDVLPSFKEISGSLGEKITLPKNYLIYGVWTESMPSVARSGTASIYFFSQGYTEASFISLAEKDNEESSAMYLALSPLTGSITTGLSEPDTSDLITVEPES